MDKKWLILGIILAVMPMVTYADTMILNETNANTKDTYIQEYQPDSNFYGSAYINVQKLPSQNERVFVKFDLSAIPSGATINNATLYLNYYDNSGSAPAGRTYDCYNTSDNTTYDSSPWNPGVLTWNNQTNIKWLQSQTIMPVSFGYVGWDVTGGLMESYSNGASLSLMIRDNIENTSTAYGAYSRSYYPGVYLVSTPYISVDYSCPSMTCGSWSLCLNYTQHRNCTDDCDVDSMQNNTCYSGNTSMNYCYDNNTLITGNFYIYNGNEYSFTEPTLCPDGCDNVTKSCNPQEYQQDLINFGIIIVIFIGFVSFALFMRKRR